MDIHSINLPNAKNVRWPKYIYKLYLVYLVVILHLLCTKLCFATAANNGYYSLTCKFMVYHIQIQGCHILNKKHWALIYEQLEFNELLMLLLRTQCQIV